MQIYILSFAYFIDQNACIAEYATAHDEYCNVFYDLKVTFNLALSDFAPQCSALCLSLQLYK